MEIWSMSIYAGPEVSNNGLIGYWDADNSLRSAKGFKSLLNLSSWTLGTGSASGNGGTTFNINGTVAENQRVLDTGPFGVSALVWDTPSNDATSDGDGGWNSDFINIDPTKMYRFSVWIRRKTIGNGLYYVGTGGFNSSNNNVGVLNRSNTAVVNTNFYFSASSWPSGNVPVNSWMLVVGHAWPVGSGTGSNHDDSGLWNTSGTKFSNATFSGDCVWQATNVKTWHRSYLFYSTDTTTQQQWYQPRIDLCDGTEPSIADLIAGVGSKWYDLSGNSNGDIINSAALYNSDGYMTFDGVDDYIDLGNPIALQLSSAITISTWINPTSTSGLGNVFNKNTNNGYRFRIGQNGEVWWYVSGNALVSNYNIINNNVWSHVVVTGDSTGLKSYVNGVLVASNSTAYAPTAAQNGNALIGAFSPGVEMFNGKIGSIQVYNRALTNSEISQSFSAFRGRYGI